METIKKRLHTFTTATAPVVEYYEKKKKLIRVRWIHKSKIWRHFIPSWLPDPSKRHNWRDLRGSLQTSRSIDGAQVSCFNIFLGFQCASHVCGSQPAAGKIPLNIFPLTKKMLYNAQLCFTHFAVTSSRNWLRIHAHSEDIYTHARCVTPFFLLNPGNQGQRRSQESNNQLCALLNILDQTWTLLSRKRAKI